MTRMMQQQIPPPVVPPVAPPLPPVELPIGDRAEDRLLKQFFSLGALTFIGGGDEDPIRFLWELDKRFRLMAYEDPMKVEIAEFMLKGPT